LDVGRIVDWLASADGQDATQFANSMLRNLSHWHGTSSFEDDVTFVVARLAGTSDP
jgi:hypothetical protein